MTILNQYVIRSAFFFVGFDALSPSQQLYSGRDDFSSSWFEPLPSKGQGIKCLAKGHNTVTMVSLEIPSLTLPTEPLCSKGQFYIMSLAHISAVVFSDPARTALNSQSIRVVKYCYI